MPLFIVDDFLSEELLKEGLRIFDEASTKPNMWNSYEGSMSARKIMTFRDPHYHDKQEHSVEADEYLKLISEMSKKKHQELNNDNNKLYTKAGFLVNWRNVDELKLGTRIHQDSAGEPFDQLIYSTVIYLNDNYDNGEIWFPDLNILHKPKSKQGAFFKSDMYHQGMPYSGADRLTIVLWHSYKIDKCWFDTEE